MDRHKRIIIVVETLKLYNCKGQHRTTHRRTPVETFGHVSDHIDHAANMRSRGLPGTSMQDCIYSYLAAVQCYFGALCPGTDPVQI